VHADIVIGADGPRSRVARVAGLPQLPAAYFGIQAIVDAPAEEADRVDVVFGRETAPGFFAWAVPAEPGLLRVGLAAPPGTDAASLLTRHLEHRFPGRRVIARSGGWIPTAPVGQTVEGRVLLVGDAAGQVKPLSGGGLYTGAVCARLAGRIAAAASLAGDPSELLTYDSTWRRAIGRMLWFGRMLRRVLESASDGTIDRVRASMDDPSLLTLFAQYGDIDRLHGLIGELAARPSLWAKLLKLLPLIDNREIAASSTTVAPSSGRHL
jgi:flavin-dependent dehydrogenase